jgi:hypothetical protein
VKDLAETQICLRAASSLFDDPESYQGTVRAAKEVRVMPTTRGHFYAELLQIDLRRLWMQHFRESLPRIAEASGDVDRAAILFPLEGPGFRHRGIDVSPGDIVVEIATWHTFCPLHQAAWRPCH